MLLPENDIVAAGTVAERLRHCVEQDPIKTDRGPVSVTISLGIASLTEDCPDLANLLEHADIALYAAKAAGRNRIKQFQKGE